MKDLQVLTSLMNAFADTKDNTSMYKEVSTIVANLSPRERGKIYEELKYVMDNLSYFTCKHSKTTAVHHDAEGDGNPYDIETCDACKFQRYKWYDLTNEGYGQFSPNITTGRWSETIDK